MAQHSCTCAPGGDSAADSLLGALTGPMKLGAAVPSFPTPGQAAAGASAGAHTTTAPVDPWDLGLSSWLCTPPDLLHGWVRGDRCVGPPGADVAAATAGSGPAVGPNPLHSQAGPVADAASPCVAEDAWADALALDGPLCDVDAMEPLDGLVDVLFAARAEGGSESLDAGSTATHGPCEGLLDFATPAPNSSAYDGVAPAPAHAPGPAPPAPGVYDHPALLSGGAHPLGPAWGAVAQAVWGLPLPPPTTFMGTNGAVCGGAGWGDAAPEARAPWAPAPAPVPVPAPRTSDPMQRTSGRASKRQRSGEGKAAVACAVPSPSEEDVESEDGAESASKATAAGSRCLPERAIRLLKEWLLSPQHVRSPYPTREEREELARTAGITAKQVSIWFTNARKRVWAPLHCPTSTRKCGPRTATTLGPASPVDHDANDRELTWAGANAASPVPTVASTGLGLPLPPSFASVPTAPSPGWCHAGSAGSSSVGGVSVDLLAGLQAQRRHLLGELEAVDARLAQVQRLIEGKRRA